MPANKILEVVKLHVHVVFRLATGPHLSFLFFLKSSTCLFRPLPTASSDLHPIFLSYGAEDKFEQPYRLRTPRVHRAAMSISKLSPHFISDAERGDMTVTRMLIESYF